MKKCPYCAEEIQDEAIKCRYCESILTPTSQLPPSIHNQNTQQPSTKTKADKDEDQFFEKTFGIEFNSESAEGKTTDTENTPKRDDRVEQTSMPRFPDETISGEAEKQKTDPEGTTPLISENEEITTINQDNVKANNSRNKLIAYSAIGFLIFIIIAIALGIFSDSSSTEFSQQPAATESKNNVSHLGVPAPASTVYSSDYDRFQVVFPQNSKVDESDINVDGVIKMKQYHAVDNEGIDYFVKVARYNDDFMNSVRSKPAFLEYFLSKFPQNLFMSTDKNPKTISSDRFVFFNKYQGLEYKYISDAETDAIRNPFYRKGIFFMTDDRSFQVSIGYTESSSSTIDNKYNTFIESFKLIN